MASDLHDGLIWKEENAYSTSNGEDSLRVYSSKAGGPYKITGRASFVLRDKDDKFRARLTTWLVDQHNIGMFEPLITTEVLRNIDLTPSLSVQERANRLLGCFNQSQSSIGDRIDLEISDLGKNLYGNGFTECGTKYAAVTESLKPDEVQFLIDQLAANSFITVHGSNNSRPWCVITMKGYEHLEQFSRSITVSENAFVAMWFDPSMEDAYRQGLEKGVRQAGYRPIRIDGVEHNNKIDDAIVAEIKRSRFLIADFTQGESGARGGVYYEAGLAHGLNMPVIFTCRADRLKYVHFDTRQYNHIVWETPDELCQKLATRISATIGDGPLVVSE